MSASGEWRPPELTREERLVIQAKQKEREILSNAMGQYLLKGYKMLGTNCDKCGNILLKAPRDGSDFCILCQELKPLPELSKDVSGQKSPPQVVEKPKQTSVSSSTAKSLNTQATTDQYKVFAQSEEVLLRKIEWATTELSQTTSVDYCKQLCVLLQEALIALGKLKEMVNRDYSSVNS